MIGLGLALAAVAVRQLLGPPAPPLPPATWADAQAWDDNATWSDIA